MYVLVDTIDKLEAWPSFVCTISIRRQQLMDRFSCIATPIDHHNIKMIVDYINNPIAFDIKTW